MIDTFLEYKIQNKLKFYQVLRSNNSMRIEDLTKKLNLSEFAIKSLTNTLNIDLLGLAKIEKNQQFLSITIQNNVNTLKLLHCIYNDSAVLQCLKFMITNDTNEPFSTFTKDAFLSKSSAYRTRTICHEYLQTIGLNIDNNKVIGDEYRIRFLIALLYYKYGIDCCHIDLDSIRLARKFILSTNHTIDLKFLENTVNEYGYFECLLILSWKRKEHTPYLKKIDDFQKLKKSFIYRDLKIHLKETIEQSLNINFSEEDYDYIYLAYCNTNSCVLADKWTQSDIDYIHQIIFTNTLFADLLERFTLKFKKNLVENRAMKLALIYFYKKFIYELQCISPDICFYLDSKNDPLTLKTFHHVSNLLDLWKTDHGIQYPISIDHAHYLSIQMESILHQFINPIHLIIISDLIVELEVMRLILTRNFSNYRIKVTSFILNTEKIDFLYNLEDSVIIVNQKFKNIMMNLDISKQNTIVPVNVEFNSFDMNEIQKSILYYEEKSFLKLITSL